MQPARLVSVDRMVVIALLECKWSSSLSLSPVSAFVPLSMLPDIFCFVFISHHPLSCGGAPYCQRREKGSKRKREQKGRGCSLPFPLYRRDVFKLAIWGRGRGVGLWLRSTQSDLLSGVRRSSRFSRRCCCCPQLPSFGSWMGKAEALGEKRGFVAFVSESR